MPTFKNTAELEVYLEKVTRQVITEDVIPVVIQEWLEVQEERVYNSYSPRLYDRRGRTGGLADPRNIQISESKINSLTTFVLENITKGNGWDTWNGKLINDLIESEDGFAGNPSTGMAARPYTEETVANLISGVSRNSILEALHSGFAKRGINIKIK